MKIYKFTINYLGIMAMKWISTYCKNAQFILKVDDDIIVNTFALVDHLKLLKKQTKVNNSVCIK